MSVVLSSLQNSFFLKEPPLFLYKALALRRIALRYIALTELAFRREGICMLFYFFLRTLHSNVMFSIKRSLFRYIALTELSLRFVCSI